MKEWVGITGNLRYWLERYGINPKGVRIVLKFENRSEMFTAKSALENEMVRAVSYPNLEGFPKQVNGFRLELEPETNS